MSQEFDLFTDRQHLATKAYGDSTNLQARADIYAYQQPKVDLPDWVLGHVSWRGDERVVDVGCGPGMYLKRLATQPGLRLMALDLSRGMLADLEQGWLPGFALPGRAVADAQAIPLRSASQDVAIAAHMLWHVSDIGLAAQELSRMLRPDGVLLAVTNAAEHTRELIDLYVDALHALGVDDHPRSSPGYRFTGENGAELLSVAFSNITRHDKKSQMNIPHAEPVLRYIQSTRPLREPSLPQGITWDDAMTQVEHTIRAVIEREGAFHVRTSVTLFECR